MLSSIASSLGYGSTSDSDSTHGARTANNALSHETTGSARVNFFFKVLRDTGDQELITLLENSHKEDIDDTIKLVFQLRDARGGKGERKQFLRCIRWYARNGYDKEVIDLLGWMPYYGRFKDLLELLDLGEELPHIADAIYKLFANALRHDRERHRQNKSISLAAKWAPTEGGQFDKKYKAASRLARELGVTLKEYRKVYLAPLRKYSNTTEVWMCAQKWNEIPYEKVASVCMFKNRKVFMKHDPQGYAKYLELVKKGDQKMNAGQVFPHQLVESYLSGDGYRYRDCAVDPAVEAQWQQLVQHYRENQNINLGKCLAVCDVSGSMYSGGSVSPIKVCISLGLIVAELADPPFGNQILTFHDKPEFCAVKGDTLRDKVANLSKAPWGMSTDFEKTFKLILDVCKRHNLRPEDCPTTIFVFSDMQFNQATRGSNGNELTNYESIRRMYENSGYQMPRIVFWNLNGTTKDFPVTATEQGTALVSGFSPSLMKLFLEGAISPYSIMRSAIDDDRYAPLKLSETQGADFSEVFYSENRENK